MYEQWVEQQRRKARRALVCAVLPMAVVLIASAGLVTFFQVVIARAAATAGEPPGSFGWLLVTSLGVTLILVALPTVFVLRAARRERTLVHLVPDREGLVCPACAVPAVPDGEQHRCPRCASRWSAAALQEYWDQHVVRGIGSARWRGDFLRRHRSRPVGAVRRGQERFQQWSRRRPRLSLLVMIGWLVLGCGVMALVPEQSLASFMRLGLPMILMMSGFFMCMFGMRQRRGRSRHCAACDYEKPVAVKAGPVCPECGGEWALPGGSVRGRAQGNRLMLIGGLVLIVLGLLTTLGPVLGRGWLVSKLPSAMLISTITSTNGFTGDEWAELITRTLTLEEQRALWEGLLDKRRRDGFISPDGFDWLAWEIGTGNVPPDLVERYYAEMFEVTGIQPDRARRGEAPNLVIDMRSSAHKSGSNVGMYLVEGIWVDDAETPVGRDLAPRWPIQLERRGLGHYRDELTSIPLPFEDAGLHRVRIVLWHIYAPIDLEGKPLPADDAGRPVFPGSVIASHRFELEHVIHVTDR